MRYFILLILAVILCLPAVAATTPNATQHKSGGTQWALFSKKNHAPKAKKEHKAKRSKNSSKRQHRAKSSR